MKLHLRELRGGEGVPLVLLHGWLGSGADFEALAARAELDGRTLLALDLPGHGGSEDPEREYGFTDVADAVVDAVGGGGPVDLLGYSMGGRLALYVAGSNPGFARRLILIGANPGIDHPQAQRDRLELDSERATQLMEAPEQFLEQWRALDLFGPATGRPWRAVRKRRAEQAATHAFGWARAAICLSVGRQLSLWNVPYGLDLETLYVVGIKDEKYVDIARELVAQNPGIASVALIGGAHHAAHLDRPGDVARRVGEFLTAD